MGLRWETPAFLLRSPVMKSPIRPQIHSKGGGYHGSLERDWSTRRMSCVVSNYSRGAQLPRHDHANAHLCIVLQGGYEEQIGRRSFQRSPFDVIWYPEEAEHAESFRSQGRHLLIDFRELPHDELDKEAGVLEGPTSVIGAARVLRVLREFEPACPLALEEAVADLLASASTTSRTERREPGWLTRVDAELNDRFRESLDLEELASSAGVTAPHLARSWRRFRHGTMGERQRELRTAHACRLLARGERPLAEVALEAGFADQSHMGRVFRRLLNLTPADLRRTLRS